MRRSIGTNLARKLITVPQLSPSHTTSRLIKLLVPSNNHVSEYTPLLIVSCSPDMIADVAFRVSPNHRQLMILEIIEDGRIQWLTKNNDHELLVHDDNNNDDDNNDNVVISMVDLPVGTVIGEVCDDDDDDDNDDEVVTEEWAWQAYMHDDDDDGKKKEVELPPSLAWAAKQGLGSGSTSI